MGKNLKGKELGTGMSQRPDGRYEYRFTISGKRYTVYGKTLAETRKKSDEKKVEVLSNSKIIHSNITLSEWFYSWFEEYKSPYLKNTQSRVMYETKAKGTFLRLLGDVKVNELTQFQVQNASNILCVDEEMCVDSVKDSLSYFRQCFSIAIINNLVNTNPFDSIMIKKCTSKKPIVVLTHEQQNIFIDEIKDNYYAYYYKTLLLTGMRVGEFGGLRWEDIDWDRKLIHVKRSLSVVHSKGKTIYEITDPKTKSSIRDIPFFSETEEVLREWEGIQNYFKKKHENKSVINDELGNLVFTTRFGNPVTRYTINSHLRRLEKKLKEKYGDIIPHIHAHCLRHTFATRCYEKGMKPLVVQRIMGHSSYKMTEYYTHVEEEVLKEAKKVGSFL